MKKRIVLVTGAGGGIGQAVARIFAKARSTQKLVLTDHINKTKSLLGLVSELNGKATYFNCDITSNSEIELVIKPHLPQPPKIDVLINVAGIAPAKMAPLVKTDLGAARKIMDVNFWGTAGLCQAVLSFMQANGYGRIVNVASISAFMADPGNIIYSVSKAAVVQLTRTLAKEATYNKADPSHPLDITVNAVAPGIVATDMANLLSKKMIEGFKASAPLGRLIRPEEVAKAIFDLASDDARAITGTVVRIG